LCDNGVEQLGGEESCLGGVGGLTLQPGAILSGRYRVERQIGAGGMGVVVSAMHLQLGQRVAIKYLPSSWLGDFDAVERFMREAWAAAQIRSPHVVRVTDIANLPSGAPYIVMEYLEGEDLAQMLARRESLSIAEATELVLQVCEAIAEAHALGIVHRDLKPSNIFCVRNLEGQRVAKVLDFGISKLTNDSFGKLGLTTTRTSLGSPAYMSPEQMHSAKEVDGRTDIWSLGVILYELLAGRPPFSAPNFAELALQIATQPALPLAAAGVEVPAGLERSVMRCLEKDRTKRFPDVASLAAALTEFAPITARLHATRADRVLRDAGSISQSFATVPAERAAQPSDAAPRPGSERPGGERSSEKVPRVKSRDRDDPSGKVATRVVRGSRRPELGHPERAGTPPPEVRQEPRGRERVVATAPKPSEKRPRPGLLLTAAVAIAVLLLTAVAIATLWPGSEPHPSTVLR
jgi:eukaryotic-like serine/threonine-protein kinase